MSKVKFDYKLIRSATNAWHVDGHAEGGQVVLTRIYGTVTDRKGLNEAVESMVAAAPARFARAGVTGRSCGLFASGVRA